MNLRLNRPNLTRAAVLATLAAGVATALPAGAAQAALAGRAEVCNQNVEVRESDWDVDTNCNVVDGDEIQISASGSIWAGVWGTGENGPAGWTWTAGDKFPKPSARSYALLARTNTFYRSVGTGVTFTYHGTGSHLYLRINDDRPGNGSGSFDTNVQVYR